MGDIQGFFGKFAAQLAGPDKALVAYAVTLATLGTALAGGLVGFGIGLEGPVWELGVLIAVAVVAERQPVRITSNTEITVSVLPMLFAAVVYGPLDAVLVGAVGLIGDFRSPYLRWLIWTSGRVLAGGL
ncbi:MAG: ECF transporter S component, partial [Actinomycetota bacterium]|nr:ECF transporter S component [Actinomycetota bacterium]